MSAFEVLVEKVVNVEDHPNADRLSIVTVRGYKCISSKVPDGAGGIKPRYNIGDLVVYIPEGAIVPEMLLKAGFWDTEKNKGILAGKNGDRVKAIKLRGVLSQGILFSVNMYDGYDADEHFCLMEYVQDILAIKAHNSHNGEGNDFFEGIDIPYPSEIVEGLDVTKLLEIKKWEPEIPASMAGDVKYIGFQNCLKFDIEPMKKHIVSFVKGQEYEIEVDESFLDQYSKFIEVID